MTSLYALAADILVGIHFLYVLFVVAGEGAILIGGLRNWNWVRNMTFRITHLIAIAVVAVQALAGVLCPLTIWEYQLREKAGQHVEWDISFIGRLLRLIIYHDLPEWFFTILHVGFAVLVLWTLIRYPPARRRR